MAELPRLNGKEVINALENAGFEVVRVRGSHHVMKKPSHPINVTVPVHGSKPLKKGTLKGIIRDSGLTVSEFLSHLK